MRTEEQREKAREYSRKCYRHKQAACGRIVTSHPPRDPNRTRIPDMSDEQRREYFRLAQRRHRAKLLLINAII